MTERSRSPALPPLVERKEEDSDAITATTLIPVSKDSFEALQAAVHKNEARLNSVEWNTVRTASLLHRDQELEASKQLLLMGFPSSMTDRDREKEIRNMASYYRVADKLQGTTTHKTKQGLAHFTIVEMWDKEARNAFLHHVKADPHKVNGSTILGRPQIPRYRREQDAPMKCAMKSLATIMGDNPRFRPTWELQALWHDSSWLLAVTTDPLDTTKVTIYVSKEMKEAFTTQFEEDWPTWQARSSSTGDSRPQKYLCVDVEEFDDEKLAALGAGYDQLINRSATPTRTDVEMPMPVPALRLPKAAASANPDS